MKKRFNLSSSQAVGHYRELCESIGTIISQAFAVEEPFLGKKYVITIFVSGPSNPPIQFLGNRIIIRDSFNLEKLRPVNGWKDSKLIFEKCEGLLNHKELHTILNPKTCRHIFDGIFRKLNSGEYDWLDLPVRKKSKYIEASLVFLPETLRFIFGIRLKNITSGEEKIVPLYSGHADLLYWNMFFKTFEINETNGTCSIFSHSRVFCFSIPIVGQGLRLEIREGPNIEANMKMLLTYQHLPPIEYYSQYSFDNIENLLLKS